MFIFWKCTFFKIKFLFTYQKKTNKTWECSIWSAARKTRPETKLKFGYQPYKTVTNSNQTGLENQELSLGHEGQNQNAWLDTETRKTLQ